MSLANAEIVSLGTEPISPASPAGEPVSFDPEFEQLSTEIAKTQSLTATVIDWPTAVRLACSLLKGKSKDLRVAGYLVFGLFQTRSFEGLLSGLRMYEAMLNTFWESAYPEKSRMRGRVGAAQWLNDRLAVDLPRKNGQSASDDLVLELEKATQDFTATVSRLLENQAPPFMELLSAVGARANDIRSRQAAAERAREEQARRAGAVETGDIADAADADKVLDSCRERLWRVAGFLFQSDPSNPLSYRITRSTTWGWLVDLPSNEGGTTQMPPVPPEAVMRVQTAAAAGEWLAAVQEVESDFLGRIFGFDLQRQCVQALSKLGTGFDPARLAVLAELAGLLHRMPGIRNLRFSDGTLFADAETRSWMDTEVLPLTSGGASRSERKSIGAGGDVADLDGAVGQAQSLVASGKLQEAVALFREGIAKAVQPRPRFLWRLQLAKLCLDAGRPQLALPQLVSLDEEVIRFSLEEWEPALSLEVVHQLFLCRQRLVAGLQERPADVDRQLQELYQRLCKLDVNAALAVEF
ncbi:MAG TPA: type VI secretion system protein TssA [Acidobacteriota bacterium]|nr:type VI secretion system protein TssA [Acidobacteriota bacterium]